MIKYLVYEAYEAPWEKPAWRAVEASGERGHMIGVAPESRVYSCWAESGGQAIDVISQLTSPQAR